MTRLAFVIPTRDRPSELAQTLELMGGLPASGLGVAPEVIVIDNASRAPVEVPGRLANGVVVRLIRLSENRGASARNVGAESSDADWLVMLDDDSSVTSDGMVSVLSSVGPEVIALGGEILLPDGRHESGGLPEVVIGCGAAIRRSAFLEAGGYDASFDYYVEESDLCARLIASGGVVTHTRSIRFEHRKASTNRDFGRILFRLVRNNAWLIARYAPASERAGALETMFERYACIGEREGVAASFEAGRAAAVATIESQPVRTLSRDDWDRLVGLAAFRAGGLERLRAGGVGAVSLVARGKGCDLIDAALADAGIAVRADASVALVGTLSPGPMLDAPADAVRGWSFMRADQEAPALR